MIISHKHRYLFVELPLTASTAIHRELRELYDGERMLHKHATYLDFLRIANAEEKTYFVFSGMRNPLDRAVTSYHKLRGDHPKRARAPGGYGSLYGSLLSMRRRRCARNALGDFETFLRRCYRAPYSDWSSLSHKDFDAVIRFESLQEDFAQVLEQLGIQQLRALPWANRTVRKHRDFLSYYTPPIRGHAKRIFGPFMKDWGYDLPPEWGDTSVHWPDQTIYHTIVFFKRLWWRRLKWRPPSRGS